MKKLQYIYKKGLSFTLAILMGGTLMLSSCETKVAEEKNVKHGDDTETPGQATRPMEMNEEDYSDTNNYSTEGLEKRKNADQNEMIQGDTKDDNPVRDN